ncbi:MAG: MSMEG_0569 family flavin-dependent oxidoreductase [Janthinobacterium lividum]
MSSNPSTPLAGSHYQVAIVGAGQAGLSMSYLLKQRGITHVVLEKQRVAHAWRDERWDTFCLVTPNWQCTLPGFSYDGDDPEGFMVKDQIVDYVERYRAHFQPPLYEGVAVEALRRDAAGLYRLQTSAGSVSAEQVVVATGSYHLPVLPAVAADLPPTIRQMHSVEYMNPQSLPEGDVMVVGTGQSGCQIAEDLHLAGRRVHLCVGPAPRVARRYRGRDVVEWLDRMGYYDLPVDQHPLGTGVREKTNHYVTGRDGGRDIDLRQFALEGMQLYGRFDTVVDGIAHFDDSLAANLDAADAVSESIKTSIDQYIAAQSIDAPSEARYTPVWAPATAPQALPLDASGITSIVWCIGFRTDFSWIDQPIFDARGYPEHDRGITAAPGLYFLGLPWQYSWGSGRFSGVARDAEHLAQAIDARIAAAAGTAAAPATLGTLGVMTSESTLA